MKEFNALRAKARDRRDKALADIRKEYEATLVQIAALEQDLLGKVSTRYRKISTAIESLIPREGSFSTHDIMAGLEAIDPTRNWRKRSLDSYLSRLRDKGIIKRVRRATIHEPALYAMADTDVASKADDRTLVQFIRAVLSHPMTTTEVTVAVLEAGFHTAMTRKNLRSTISRELKADGCRCLGGRWTLAE